MFNSKRATIVSLLLLFFAVWDLALAVAAIGFPEFWFRTFHGVDPVDPQALLRRTGGVWLAFAVFHFIAWRKWKAKPFWLVAVGGMRLGEIFADYLYLFSAQDITTIGRLTFLAATPANVFFSWYFISHGLRGLYGLRYFGPVQYNALRALADVLVVGKKEVISPEKIALRVDGYLANFHTPRKIIAKIALIGIEFYPLLSLKPPFSTMDYASRKRFVQDRFYRPISQRRFSGWFRRIVKAMIRFGQQLSFMGYYSDPEVFPSVGYTPFSKRPRFNSVTKDVDAPPQLEVVAPKGLDTSKGIKADVVVIGSGAAGAVMAHHLVDQGRDVLLLERGRSVPRDEFVEDEVESIARLYDEGALQLAQNFQLQVLQGSCVGGTTVVNNAVCFDPPARVLERWNSTAHEAAIDLAKLQYATQCIRSVLQIRDQSQTGSILNPSDKYFLAGAQKLGLDGNGNKLAAVEANIGRCLGCGYCNIGCKYGSKLDMRETFLPWAQQNTSNGGSLTVLSECKVRRLGRRGANHVESVDCELSDGRRLRVEANTVVLCAGAVSSPFLLLKSGIARERAGRDIGFNIGSPITAKYATVVNAFDGLQISHYLDLEDKDYVIETWFNPPVAQALGMPGWFEDHFNNMLDYPKMAAAAPLVGTDGEGRVKVNIFGDVAIDFTPSDRDLGLIKDGLKQVAHIFLEGGAERVMPATFDYRQIKTAADVEHIDEWIQSPADVTLGTGHPQGGCAVSANPDRGVVDPEFRVRGFDNLFCCDASVFPTAIGVNPQVTVMALAKYAAEYVK